MKKLSLLVFLLAVTSAAYPQFSQKISLNVAPGIFKTFGNRFTDYTGPLQFPNFNMGFKGDIGLQMKLNDHFSLAVEAGIMISDKWNYNTPDKKEWLHWIIEDTTTHIILAEGTDHFKLANYSIAVKPKYYFFRNKRLNPYLFVGISLDLTKCSYEDNQWNARKQLGILPPDDNGPYNDYMHKNSGTGFNPGIGLEYSPRDQLRFFAEAGFYFIRMKSENFYTESWAENFKAFALETGVRFNIIRLKEL